MLWSTYFPAQVSALAVDAAGNVYLTGNTTKSDFPVTAGLPAGAVSANIGGATGAFVTKLSATGDKILYSGLIAGHAKDCGSGSSCFLSIRNTSGVSVAVDPAGNGYFAGNTETSDLPTTSGALATKGVGAFVAKVNAAGTGLIYLTYIGPGYAAITPITYPANVARAIAADSAGNAYLAGSSFDPQFPSTAGAYQQGFSGPAPAPGTPPRAPPDAFALKINPGGTAAVWGTYLGGPAAVDTANAIALDASGNVWVTGTTASPIFPNQQGWMVGGNFVTGFNASGSALIYSALYPNDAAGQSIALDAAGLAHIAGPSGLVAAVKPGAAVAPRIFGIANAAFGGVLGRAAPREIISIYGPHIGPSTPVVAVPDSAGLLP
ncbi:MAG: SBBP repeat-containing protein, partial [Acidobacteriia bacterium]|nr:SBBP repeat-containing protein [Terriglobia bacterium]